MELLIAAGCELIVGGLLEGLFGFSTVNITGFAELAVPPGMTHVAMQPSRVLKLFPVPLQPPYVNAMHLQTSFINQL